jgi:hypothetical protein
VLGELRLTYVTTHSNMVFLRATTGRLDKQPFDTAPDHRKDSDQCYADRALNPLRSSRFRFGQPVRRLLRVAQNHQQPSITALLSAGRNEGSYPHAGRTWTEEEVP